MKTVLPENFFEACVSGDLEIVNEFIKQNKYPIDIRNEHNWTGLIMACFNERREVAELLIENRADINATNYKGTTVFMYAKTPIQAKQTETEFLSYLLEKGADINARDNKGWTVLDYVKSNGFEVLADWMISKGAKYS